MQHVRGHEVFCRGFALGHCATRRGKLNVACKVDAIKFSLFCFASFVGIVIDFHWPVLIIPHLTPLRFTIAV